MIIKTLQMYPEEWYINVIMCAKKCFDYLTMQRLIVVRDTRNFPINESDKFRETSRREDWPLFTFEALPRNYSHYR